MSQQIRIGLTPIVARKVFVTFKGQQPPMAFDVPLDATEFVITEQLLGQSIAEGDPWYAEIRDYSGPLDESPLSFPCGGFVNDQQGQPKDRNIVNPPCGPVLIGYEEVG